MARWPKTDKWGGKIYNRENTAFWTILRGGVRVQAWHAAVWIEFAFGRLGVITTQASWLAQMGCGVLIDQRACWLMMYARESIEERSIARVQGKWQLAATTRMVYFVCLTHFGFFQSCSDRFGNGERKMERIQSALARLVKGWKRLTYLGQLRTLKLTTPENWILTNDLV